MASWEPLGLTGHLSNFIPFVDAIFFLTIIPFACESYMIIFLRTFYNSVIGSLRNVKEIKDLCSQISRIIASRLIRTIVTQSDIYRASSVIIRCTRIDISIGFLIIQCIFRISKISLNDS